MAHVLCKRLKKVEVATRTHWLMRPEAICPWKWTERFAAATPEFAPILAKAESVAPARAPAYLRTREPRLSAGHVACLLAQHSTAFFQKWEYADWNLTPDQHATWMMLVDLLAISKAYAEKADDPVPEGNVMAMRMYCSCKNKGGVSCRT